MTKPRVFISHSAKDDPPAQNMLTALAQALREVDYAVLLDQDGLELGVNWRHTLNLWIGGCDAAIVLLSEKALRSSFVAYEVSILAYRSTLDSNFKLVPVFLDPVDYGAVEKSRLSPSRIHDVQSVVKKVPQDQAIRSVLGALGRLHQIETPIDWQVKQLSHLLRLVPEFELEEEAEHLGVDLGGWAPDLGLGQPDEQRLKRLRVRLAMRMLGVGLEGSAQTIRNIRSRLPADPGSLEEMVMLVGSSWVDCRSVGRIPEAAKTVKAVAVNGQRHLTAKMYVIRACRKPPRDPWVVASVDGIVGENAQEDLESLIANSLIQALKINDAEELEEALNLLSQFEPVFVALPARGINSEIIKSLREKFPWVTFFLLTGSEIPDQAVLAESRVEFIRPELEQGAEEHFCDQYEQKSKFIMLGG